MKITNARIVLKDRVIENGTIEIENERIIGIREGVEKDSDIDAGGFLIFNNLVEKTGIPFKPFRMNVEELKSNLSNLKHLTDNDAKRLNKMGIYMAGLDVIEGNIIEVNVTSPCYFIREIDKNFDVNIENEITDYILHFASSRQFCLSV